MSASATPDGSCLVVLERVDGQSRLRTFHWSSFGSTKVGYSYDLGTANPSSFSLTSLKNRNVVFATFMVGGDLTSQRLRISTEASESQFHADLTSRRTSTFSSITQNVLLDIWHELWVKFPVEPAIQRSNLSLNERRVPTFTIISELGSSLTPAVQSYWKDRVRLVITRNRTHSMYRHNVCSVPSSTPHASPPVKSLSEFKFWPKPLKTSP